MTTATVAKTPNVNDLELELSSGGERERVRFGSFTGVDAAVFRREMGMPLQRAWFAVYLRNEEWDLDLIAGIVWLHKRKTNPQLAWEEVAGRVTYDDAVIPTTRLAAPSTNGDAPETDPS